MTVESLKATPILMQGRSSRALLFLHGFTSTPQSLVPVAEKVAAAGWTVSIPLLPGHGTRPEDMAGCSGKQWLDFALAKYDELARKYPNPAVAGLSMGGALALHVAAQRPVPLVVSLAPALYLKDWRVRFLPILKYLMPYQPAISNDVKGTRFREISYSRFPTSSVAAMLEVMRVVRAELSGLTAPLLTMQAADDHVIPPQCMEDLIAWAGSEIKQRVRLTNSYHVITLDNEYEIVGEHMLKFLERFQQ